MKSTKLRRDICGLFSNTVENQLIAEQIERRKVRLLYCTSHFLRQINAAKKILATLFGQKTICHALLKWMEMEN